MEDVVRANAMATGGMSPQLYMILDVPVSQGLARKGGVASGDRIEKEGEAFLQRVHDGYRRLAREIPTARLVPAGEDPSRVQASIRGLLKETFPETFLDSEV